MPRWSACRRGADGQPACPAELAFTPVFYETLMLVRPQTPGPLRFAAFASGCSYRALGERWLAEQQAAVEVHEVNSYHSMLACVASGATPACCRRACCR